MISKMFHQKSMFGLVKTEANAGRTQLNITCIRGICTYCQLSHVSKNTANQETRKLQHILRSNNARQSALYIHRLEALVYCIEN